MNDTTQDIARLLQSLGGPNSMSDTAARVWAKRICEEVFAPIEARNERLRDKVATYEAALRDVREEICRGPVNDVLWHRAYPSETTVDFIGNTLNDDWDYDEWLENRDFLQSLKGDGND